MPDEIVLSADRATVTLVCRGATPVALPAAALRAACRCAACRRAACTGPGAPAGVTVAGINPMGGNAVNIVFSDGHDRGVFPWDMLWSLAPAATNLMEAQA